MTRRSFLEKPVNKVSPDYRIFGLQDMILDICRDFGTEVLQSCFRVCYAFYFLKKSLKKIQIKPIITENRYALKIRHAERQLAEIQIALNTIYWRYQPLLPCPSSENEGLRDNETADSGFDYWTQKHSPLPYNAECHDTPSILDNLFNTHTGTLTTLTKAGNQDTLPEMQSTSKVGLIQQMLNMIESEGLEIEWDCDDQTQNNLSLPDFFSPFKALLIQSLKQYRPVVAVPDITDFSECMQLGFLVHNNMKLSQQIDRLAEAYFNRQDSECS